MSMREQGGLFAASVSKDTGLGAESFTLSLRDGSTVSFDGTPSGYVDSEEGTEMYLHVDKSYFSSSPELLDTVVRGSDSQEFAIVSVDDRVGYYRFLLSSQERLRR